MVKPNSERVIVQPIDKQPTTESGILINGSLKAGENLYIGKVVQIYDPYETEKGLIKKCPFQIGQMIYYSEYSAATMVDIGAWIRGEKSLGEIYMHSNAYIVVAEDDIMAYDDVLPKEEVKDAGKPANTVK